MESSIRKLTDNLVKDGQKIADRAADKIQGGILHVQHAAEDAGRTLSDEVEDLRSDVGPAISHVVGGVQSMSRRGVNAVSDIASQVSDAVSNTSDAIVAYTKKHPANALAIAAASGALLYAIVKASRSSRD